MSDDKSKKDGDFDFDDDATGTDELGLGLGKTLRKLVSAGISSAFLSEETIRAYLADARLPKDLLRLVLQGAQKSKEEITSRVTKEVSQMLEKVNWSEEASSFLAKHKIRVSAEFEFVAKEKESKSSEDSDQ